MGKKVKLTMYLANGSKIKFDEKVGLYKVTVVLKKPKLSKEMKKKAKANHPKRMGLV